MSIYLKSIINKLTPESRNVPSLQLIMQFQERTKRLIVYIFYKLLREHKHIAEMFYEHSLLNPDALLNVIENELLFFTSASQTPAVFSESMQLLLEKHGYMLALNGHAIILISLFCGVQSLTLEI